MAPEFYDTIPSHPSWPMVIINFILDNEVGIFARAKRLRKENGKADALTKKALLDGSDSDKSE
jgi:sphingolipid 4-desaturase/C4-monooxygenase